MRTALIGVALFAEVFVGPARAYERAETAKLDSNGTSQFRSEMLCSTNPMFEGMVIPLQRAGLIGKRADKVYDSMNVFRLREPIVIEGIRVVAIFGYQADPESGLRFRRSPGTASDTSGIITDAPVNEARRWASKMSGNLLVQSPSDSDLPGTTDISCSEINAPQ